MCQRIFNGATFIQRFVLVPDSVLETWDSMQIGALQISNSSSYFNAKSSDGFSVIKAPKTCQSFVSHSFKTIR